MHKSTISERLGSKVLALNKSSFCNFGIFKRHVERRVILFY